MFRFPLQWGNFQTKKPVKMSQETTQIQKLEEEIERLKAMRPKFEDFVDEEAWLESLSGFDHRIRPLIGTYLLQLSLLKQASAPAAGS